MRTYFYEGRLRRSFADIPDRTLASGRHDTANIDAIVAMFRDSLETGDESIPGGKAISVKWRIEDTQ